MKSNIYNVICLCSFAFLVQETASAQGSFRNLAFEDARIIPIVGHIDYPHAIATSNALPGWNPYIGGIYQSVVYHDLFSLGAALISIHDTNGFIPVLEGRYTVLLQPSSGGVSAAIGQVGTVPGTAQSVRFYGVGEFSVFFAGQQLPVTTVGTTSTATIFGADITAYPGQLGELRFQGFGWLDNIYFSNEPIPEPSAIALLAVGVLSLAWRARGRNGKVQHTSKQAK